MKSDEFARRSVFFLPLRFTKRRVFIMNILKKKSHSVLDAMAFLMRPAWANHRRKMS